MVVRREPQSFQNNFMIDFEVNHRRTHFQTLAAHSLPDVKCSQMRNYQGSHTFDSQGPGDCARGATGAAIPMDDRDMMTQTSEISKRTRVCIAAVDGVVLIELFSCRMCG